MPPRLSKTRIQSGRQCLKRLWLELHQPQLAHWDRSSQSRLDAGNRFGEQARALLGDGLLIDAAYPQGDLALAQTAAALARPWTEAPLLFEAAFEYQQVRVRVDALRRQADADTLIEVKASTRLKDEHHWDCAIQTWVLRGAGRPVRQIILAHRDHRFRPASAVHHTGKLKQVDISHSVEALQPKIESLVRSQQAIVAGPVPSIQTGKHCQSPHRCPFLRHCRGQG